MLDVLHELWQRNSTLPPESSPCNIVTLEKAQPKCTNIPIVTKIEGHMIFCETEFVVVLILNTFSKTL